MSVQRAVRAQVPWYPAVVAGAMVLATYVDVDVWVGSLVRPLVVVLGGVVLAQVILSIALMSVHRGAVATATMLVLIRAHDPLHVAAGIALILAVAAATLWWAHIKRRSLTSAGLTRLANPLSLLLIGAVVLTGIANGRVASAVSDMTRANRSGTVTAGDPSVVLILLDGYPRADTANRLLGFNNDSFLSSLAERAFHVASASRSNYMYTSLTLASMLHMRHVDELDLASNTPRELINSGPVLDEFRSRGYEVRVNAVPWEVASLRSADHYCADGRMTELEFQLLRTSLLLPAARLIDPALLANRVRGYVNDAFRCVQSALPRERPQLVITHVAAPHLPVVFQADGSPAKLRYYSDTRQELGMDYKEFAEAYVGQLQYVNARTIEAVDAVIEADPDALVIVMSDHGSELHLDWTGGGGTDLDERFSTLFAARTPGHPCLFGNAPTPVNLFPRIFAAYFGIEVPPQPGSLFVSSPTSPLELSRIENPDAHAAACPET